MFPSSTVVAIFSDGVSTVVGYLQAILPVVVPFLVSIGLLFWAVKIITRKFKGSKRL